MTEDEDMITPLLTISEQGALNAYKEALRVIPMTDKGSHLSREAHQTRDRFEDSVITFNVTCMLCPATFPHRVTVKEAAEYIYPPRGICGRHDPSGMVS